MMEKMNHIIIKLQSGKTFTEEKAFLASIGVTGLIQEVD